MDDQSKIQRYDTLHDTFRHIERLRNILNTVAIDILKRGESHDQSKLIDPEMEYFSRVNHELAGLEYGSSAYSDNLKRLKPALDHHYKHNRHHPEFHPNGFNGMNLLDIIEMLCDWKAASERHATGNIMRSIDINVGKFEIEPQMAMILKNTAAMLFDIPIS